MLEAASSFFFFKSEGLNLQDPSGSVQVCTGIALPFVPYKELFCVKIITLSLLFFLILGYKQKSFSRKSDFIKKIQRIVTSKKKIKEHFIFYILND